MAPVLRDWGLFFERRLMALVKSNGNQAAGTALNQYVNVSGSEYLSVLVLVGPTATAAGDAVLTVQPYRDNAADPSTYPGATGPSTGTSTSAGPTLAPITLPTLENAAAVLVSNVAYIWARYRVAGLHAVQIQAKNNNVAGLPVEIDYDLG
jgi:hypothetical protein